MAAMPIRRPAAASPGAAVIAELSASVGFASGTTASCSRSSAPARSCCARPRSGSRCWWRPSPAWPTSRSRASTARGTTSAHDSSRCSAMPPRSGSPSRRCWIELIHPDDRAQVIEDEAGWTETTGGVHVGEYRLRARDGRYRWIRDAATARPGRRAGEKALWFGVLTDITESRDAQEALRHSEQLLRSVLETAQDAFVAVDGAGQRPRVEPSSRDDVRPTPRGRAGTHAHRARRPASGCGSRTRSRSRGLRPPTASDVLGTTTGDDRDARRRVGVPNGTHPVADHQR